MQAVSGLNAIFSQSVLCMTLTLTCADKKSLVSPRAVAELGAAVSQVSKLYIYISLYLDSLLEREKENPVAWEKPACKIMGNLLHQ